MSKKPTILIIAGGSNSRFFPLNTQTHKGFIELLGKPLLIRALESARDHGFDQAVIVASSKDLQSGNLKSLLEKYSLAENVTSLEQKEARGAANAVLTAKDHLGEHYILASPYYTNLGEVAELLWNKQQKTNSDCVFLASETPTPELYGILELDQDKVLSIVEKPAKGTEPSNLKVNSVYLLNTGYLKTLEHTAENEYALEDAFSEFAKTGYISYELNRVKLPSLKYAWHLHTFFTFLIENEKTNISPDAKVAETAVIDDSLGPVIIEASARVGHAAKVVGPCYIGKNAMVGDYCFVRGGCSIEEGAVVGSNTEVVRSLVLKKASIHYSYIADSILGPGSKIGAGLITANKRLDRKNVLVKIKGRKVDSGTNAFGVITGENAALGIRTSTMPGTLIGANSLVYPGKVLFEDVEHGETVK